MLTISKPLGPAQIRRYHAEEFTNARENYYTSDDEIQGQWHGRLARAWGLTDGVGEEHLHRLADGQHPLTGDQLVRPQATREYVNRQGQRVQTLAHRAGWDATFSAPKSVSLTALVGGDSRVRDAHHESVVAALDELERSVQARVGGNHAPETTRQWVAALFEHDSARPVNGYAAPQVHTHVVIFNVTERANGEGRALQPRELYRAQAYATAVYRSELAHRLMDLGYTVDRGASGQPEIRGYTPAYLEASSPRRQQIAAHLAKVEYTGAEAAEIAAHQTREPKKRQTSHAEMQQRHHRLAAAFGDQPAGVVEAARAQHVTRTAGEAEQAAQVAVSFAIDRQFEREAVVDERALLRDALKRSMGEATLTDIKHDLNRRLTTGETQVIEESSAGVARLLTTREMIRLEQATIEQMRAGQQTQAPIVSATDADLHTLGPSLSPHQRAAVQQILASGDRLIGLEGIAGSGKTTALAAVRQAAERAGYKVEGFAPTSRAARQLAEAGIGTTTLQQRLSRREPRARVRPSLYVIDESSLAGTRQIHQFLQRLQPHDRVLLVGDTRQHHANEAGRPFRQLQQAGLDTARLGHIVRQRDPSLRRVVEALAHGEVPEAVHHLIDQGRVHGIRNRDDRLATIALQYLGHPDTTLIIAPDHDSRRDLNQIVHEWRRQSGQLQGPAHHVRVLVPRSELTGADRQWAPQYDIGDVVRYTTGSTRVGLPARSYARVDAVNARENQLTVISSSGAAITYDPRRLQGVTVYRDDRTLAVGERVQFTAPFRARRIANGERGALTQIDKEGHMQVRLDSGRTIAFTVADHPHLDHGYAVTSHTSQGHTADRVLIHVDTERVGEQLVNRRFAYVAVSRGRFDAQIYTNDPHHLAEALSRDVVHRSALEPVGPSVARTLEPAPASSHRHEVERGR
jgi:conjugative relaxase-like TrwC/TraI family protein